MPVLNIDRRLMQYRRYERKYPNSTCKEQCDPKKGLVPHAQVSPVNVKKKTVFFLFSLVVVVVVP